MTIYMHPVTPCVQLCVAAYLAWGLDEPIYGGVLLALILPQARCSIAHACGGRALL